MILFVWPFAIFLLVVPVLVRLFFSAPPQNDAPVITALRVPFWGRLKDMQTHRPAGEKSWPIALFLTLSWICFVVAVMRPAAYDMTAPLEHQARNIILAIDASGSMAEQDFDLNNRPVTRMALVKKVVNDFIQNRPDDNIGMVIFGTEAYEYAPLSFDKKTLQELFDEVNIGIAGELTAIGDAVALSAKGVSGVQNASRIIILLSDGFANAGNVSIDQAIALAQKQGAKVYTVGVGSNQKLVQSFFGTVAVNPSLDLDEASLKKIAKQTGGKYFRAKSSKELQEIYKIIDQLEKTKADDLTGRPRIELFYVPLTVCLLFLLVSFILKRRQP